MFYVYIYLDPRKPGRFEYKDFCFLFEPFYVGKGSGDRMYNHMKKSELSKNCFKSNKINNILSNGQNPYIIKISEYLCEDMAYEKESILVNDIGRLVSSDGPLVNLSKGGKGGSTGYSFNKEQLLKRSISSKMSQSNPEYKKLRREIAINNFKNVDFKKRHREATIKGLTKEAIEKGKMWLLDDNKKEEMISKVKKTMSESKESRSLIQKESWRNEELIERHKSIMSEITNREDVKMKIRKSLIKKVYQYDLNNNFIKLWPSVIDASKELNISRSSISNNCRGLSKTSNGFIWSYIELNL